MTAPTVPSATLTADQPNGYNVGDPVTLTAAWFNFGTTDTATLTVASVSGNISAEATVEFVINPSDLTQTLTDTSNHTWAKGSIANAQVNFTTTA